MKSAGAEPLAPPGLVRTVAGWTAVAVSTTSASVWAFWGGIENFHEGWYYRELWRNIALACVQYLPWMFVPMVAGLLALWHRWVGVAVHLALAGGVLWLFGLRSAGGEMLGLPVVVLAVLYGSGRVSRVHWARRALVGIPLATLICAGAYPGYRAVTRLNGVDASTRRIRGNGVELVWAPAGPGWDDMGFSWFEAARRCGHLSATGEHRRAGDGRVAFANGGRDRAVDELARPERGRVLGSGHALGILSIHARQGGTPVGSLQPRDLLVGGGRGGWRPGIPCGLQRPGSRTAEEVGARLDGLPLRQGRSALNEPARWRACRAHG